jgi:hypothetical protein
MITIEPEKTCAHCGEPEFGRGSLMTFGTAQTGRVLMHYDCWTARQKERAKRPEASLADASRAGGDARISPPEPISPSAWAAAPAAAPRPPASVLEPSRTLVELFAGGGMARLGFGGVCRVVLANDWSPMKARAYRMNFGRDHFKGGDVAALTTSDVPAGPSTSPGVDCLWMSPPCQDTSEAGNRKGLSGERSGAFWPAWRLVEALVAEGRAPKTLVYENPVGAKTKRKGDDKPAVEMVREAFETAGYGCATFTVDAEAFLPQSRKRVFVAGAYGVPGADVQAVVDRAMRALKALPKRCVGLTTSSISARVSGNIRRARRHISWRWRVRPASN